MTKKLLLTATLIISSVLMLNAQCVPDPNFTSPGIYPDSATNLPDCYATIAYSTVITAVVPADTLVSGIHIPIDSIGVDSILGLPGTLGWATNTVSHYWHGGTSGCCLISGMTNHSDVGTWPLRISVTAHASGLAVPSKILYYRIIVKDTNVSVTNYDNSKFLLFQNSPNPFESLTTISFNSPISEVYSFTVYDVIGNIVYNQAINANIGLNNFNFSSGSLSSGIYIYKLSNTKESFTRRMIIANK